MSAKASTAAIKAAWISKKRAEARAAGLCITCCEQRPDIGYTVCRSCKESAHERRVRRRAMQRQRAEWGEIVIAHETAGDKAQAHHLFDSAVQHYKEALNVPALASDHRLRLVEKLGSASYLSSNPTAVLLQHDQMPNSYLGDPEKTEKVVEALLRTARQMVVDSKIEESLTLCIQAARIAEARALSRLHKIATLRAVGILNSYGRSDEAICYLDGLGKIDSSDDLSVQVPYYWARGVAAAKYGLKRDSYENFEKAVQLAKKDADLHRAVTVLGDYGLCAMNLGDTERGKALYEQALFVVRRNHMGWLVPYLCLGYADLLFRMGQYSSAHSYLLEALASDAQASLLDERLAAVGIPIALRVNDKAALAKCTRPAAIDLAFQSHNSGRIGSIAATFAQFYAAQSQQQKARVILHKALDFVTYIDNCIELPPVIAQHGSRADIPQMRVILEARLRLPAASVAEACLFLFDALVAKRMRQRERVQHIAAEAAKRFDELRLFWYSDLARSLISIDIPRATTPVMGERPFPGSLLALTRREQDVVELVLRGSTNREIAERLAIREHTVEKHMGSIMNRLGIRSRYQLVDALPKTP